MNVLLTVLGGAAWVLSRLGLALLVLLAVVLALALLALLIPFCADVAWEGEEGSPDGLGRLRVRAGRARTVRRSGRWFPPPLWRAPCPPVR